MGKKVKEEHKEREKKVRILDQIDNLRVIQNNHFMVGKLEDALKEGEKIIELAKEGNLLSIVAEQQLFLDEIRGKIKERNKISLVKDAFEIIKNEFEKLIADNNITDAHKIVINFKEKFGKDINLMSIAPIKELIIKEMDIWGKFTTEQKKIKNELEKLDAQFKKFLEKEDLENMNKIMTNAKNLLPNVFDEETTAIWESNENDFVDFKRKAVFTEKIDEFIEKSSSLKDKYLFEEAILEIDNAMEMLKNEDIPKYKKILSDTRQEIIAAETKYNKLYLKLAEYKGKFRENMEFEFLHAALINCERIVHLSQLIGMEEIEKEYTKITEDLKKEIEEKAAKDLKEREELMKRAKDIEKMITIDDDVLPLVEDFSVKDLLGDLSDDINIKIEQIGSLLTEYRVDVIKDVINKFMLITSSGEVIEDKIPREAYKAEGENGVIIYKVRSGLTNRLEDVIEIATITDLIPYNFEIVEVRFNGELVKEQPDKVLLKDGVLLKWEIKNLAQKEKVQIDYHLRNRISRTIIIVVNGQLKVIKTHVNLTKLEQVGLYDVKIPITNSFNKVLNGVIIEDIIPLIYLHFVIAPTELTPNKTTNMEIGELFKWNIENLDIGMLNYHYKLLESNKFENTKITVSDLIKEAQEFVKAGKINQALEKYKEIKSQLISSIK